MSEQVTVTYSLEEVLKRIENKLETLQKDVTDLKVGQATLTEKVGGMDKRLERVESEQATMVKAISDLQGFRSLIVPIVVAVATALLTLLFRLVPTFSP
ncbi:shikimate dehydrogenase [Crocosphaera sp. XPORK-15E]|uniref:shikimate dehydrogenase n=1 Tax=Crocosphaera sp. XPORK-15E TaxID=3110247 RepID=UPI002B21B960|nr:shikimate dehydrogenase [Crocosphaera sp. XPORK-15E]MEA5533458.1 shikimate dehydrogenase [Crocosphaera sp. XPORK-15E]